MNLHNFIPIARLNGTVRKRLFSILVSEYRENSSLAFERKESQWLHNECSERCIVATSCHSKVEEAVKMPLDFSTKRSKLEKGNSPQTLEYKSMSESGHFGSSDGIFKEDATSLCNSQNQEARKSKLASNQKRRKPRIFRRFLRYLACNHDEVSGKNSSKYCKGELSLSDRFDTDNAEKIVSDGDSLNLKRVKVEETVSAVDTKEKECVLDISMEATKEKVCFHDSSGNTCVRECQNNPNSPAIGCKEDDNACCHNLMPTLRVEGVCDSQTVPNLCSEPKVYPREPEAKISKNFPESDDDLYLNCLFDQKNDNVSGGKGFKNMTRVEQSRKKGRKKKLTKKSKGNYGRVPENGPECNDKKRKQRMPISTPNYFLALKVDNPIIYENVKKFQENIVNEEPLLKDVMIAIPTLHLTLLVMSLGSENDIEKAKNALQESKESIQCIFSKCTKELTFSGIENFRNKVVYLGLEKESQQGMLCSLQEGVTALKNLYAAKGIDTTANRKTEFVPHVTVMKMSKNIVKMKKHGIRHIDEKLYKDFLTCEFGKQKFSELLLCSMLSKKDDEGFYKVLDRIDLGMK